MSSIKTDITFGSPDPNSKYFDRPGAYLVCVRDGKTLVISTPKGRFLLGGGIDPGESHAQCILREVMEEVGFSAKVDDYIGCAESYYEHSRKYAERLHTIQYYYKGTLTSRLCAPQEEGNALEWISVDGIDGKMHKRDQAWAIKRCLKAEKENG